MKKLTRNDIRRLVLEEVSSMNRARKRTLMSALFEEADPEAAPTPTGGGAVNIAAGPAEVLKAVSALVSDPAKKQMLLSGHTDGDPNDEVITITPGTSTAAGLTPTQSEIGSSQSLDDQIKDLYGNLDVGIKGGKVNSKEGAFPILVFKGSGATYILDGHHRWSQVYATNPNANLVTAEISAPGVTTPEAALGLTHAILLALYGKSPTKPFKGQNLFDMSDDDIKSYVKANIVDSALQKLAAAKLIPNATDKDAAANLYATNLAKLKKTKGAFSRTVMPQPLDAGDSKGLTEVPPDAAAGKINFNNPKPEDVKGESRHRNQDNLVMERWQKLAGILKG
jgi:hypothetical protein